MIFYTEELLIFDFRDNLKSICEQITSLYYSHAPEWQKDIFDQVLLWQKEESFEIPTSGTTGKSKTILAKKVHLQASARATCNYFRLGPGNTILLGMSPLYIGGRMMIIRAIEHQLKLFCVQPSANPLKDIDISLDFTALVPLQVQQIIQEAPKRLQGIKNILIGGGSCSSELIETLKDLKVNAFNSFGMTETYSHIGLRKISPFTDDYFFLLDHVNCSTNVENHLIIQSPALGIESLKTNDIVHLEGRKLKWIGRTDDIINSGGVKINLTQLETKIQSILKRPIYLTSIPDIKFGEKLILVDQVTFEGTKEQTLELIKPLLPKYHSPKDIIYVKEFPLTNTGKLKRNTLREIISNFYIR